jgi:hypothetical protein
MLPDAAPGQRKQIISETEKAPLQAIRPPGIQAPL